MKKIYYEFVQLDFFKKFIIVIISIIIIASSSYFFVHLKKKIDLYNYYFKEAEWVYVGVLLDNSIDSVHKGYTELENEMLRDGYTRAEFRNLYVKAVRNSQKAIRKGKR